MFDLTGTVAVITGSTKGIGRAIAEALAHHGAKVVVSSRKADRCEAVAAAITEAGGTAIAIPCNVSHADALEALVAGTLDAWSRIDTLVLNAAANPHYGPFLDIPDDMFEKTMAVNVRSHMKLCKLVLPGMRARRAGAIIIVSSSGANSRGSEMLGTYCLSKAADEQMVRNLCVGYGRDNIRVNGIAPGMVRTDFARALWDDPVLLAEAEKQHPLGRIGEPEDIAGIAVYLASRAAAWTSGHIFAVDGGYAVGGE